MTVGSKLNAFIHIHQSGVDHNDLKRLALFFDKIYYIPPTIFTLKNEVYDDPKRFKKHDNGSKQILDFNIYRDTEAYTMSSTMTLKRDLVDTLEVFEEKGLVENVPIDPNSQFIPIRDDLASMDVDDTIFNRISGTSPEDYDLSKLRFGSITAHFPGTEGLEAKDWVFARPVDGVPQSVAYSYETTTTLYMAQEMSAFPVFLNPRHRKIMEYRYEQYKKGLETLKSYSSDVISPADFKTSYGEITFNIANSIFTSDLISQKTPEQIIKYRNAMADARQHFLSENLMEIAAIAQENPWNAQTKGEIEKYIVGKLTQDILHYNDKSREIWEKLFGSIFVHLAAITKPAVVGGGAGGILGSFIPNTSPWQMLLIGLLAGVVNEAPNVVKTVTETVLEQRKEKRSSIAYLAKFR